MSNDKHSKVPGPYMPPVIYDPQRGYLIDSTTGERVEAAKAAEAQTQRWKGDSVQHQPSTAVAKPWVYAPRTDAIWKRHTEDPRTVTLEGRQLLAFELQQYYEMASHACKIERELSAALALRSSEADQRDKVLAEAIDRIRLEYLTDKTGTEEDEAYDAAVAHCIGAVIAMMSSPSVSDQP